MQIVYQTLEQLGVSGKKRITLFNKQDKVTERELFRDLRADRALKVSVKTVLLQHRGLGQPVQQRGFAGIGITHNGGYLHTAPFPLPSGNFPVLLHLLQLPVQLGNSVLNQSPVHLQFLLSRPSGADAASKPGQRNPKSRKAAHAVFQLSKLHLDFSFAI